MKPPKAGHREAAVLSWKSVSGGSRGMTGLVSLRGPTTFQSLLSWKSVSGSTVDVEQGARYLD